MNFLISNSIQFNPVISYFLYTLKYTTYFKKKSLKENQAGEIGINVNDLGIFLVHQILLYLMSNAMSHKESDINSRL